MMKQHMNDHNGFTLIELLIAIGISGLVLTGIFQVYQGQIRTNNTQNQIVDMQQSIRVAMYFMEREIRMAGLDPSTTASSGILTAATNTITISIDATGGLNDGVDNDGDGIIDEGVDGIDNDSDGLTDEPDEAEWFDGTPEQVIYALSNDTNNNGQNDALEGINNDACDLLRNGQRVASNIDALNFAYFGMDEAQNNCDENCRLTNPLGPQLANEQLADVRSVQITVVARSGQFIPGLSIPFTDTRTYFNRPGDVILAPQNDGFRRIHLLSEVRIRNLGLL
jgi:type IV pilus assembly protein PilW